MDTQEAYQLVERSHSDTVAEVEAVRAEAFATAVGATKDERRRIQEQCAAIQKEADVRVEIMRRKAGLAEEAMTRERGTCDQVKETQQALREHMTQQEKRLHSKSLFTHSC
jgi:hypothetical protein